MSESLNTFGNIVIRTMSDDLKNIVSAKSVSAEKKVFDIQDDIDKSFVASKEIKRVIPFYKHSIFGTLVLVVCLLSVTVGTKFLYDWVVSRNENIEIPSNPLEQAALFSADADVKIFLDSNSSVKDQIKSAIDQISSQCARLTIYEDGINPLKSDVLFQKLEISIPEQVKSSLGEDYNLFVYADENNSSSKYNLNLVFRANETDLLKKSLSDWSNNSMVKDLSFLNLANTAQNQNEAYAFSGVSYKNTNVYFTNLPDIYTTVDYAVLENEKYLVITTTKEGMIGFIDKIIPEGEKTISPIQNELSAETEVVVSEEEALSAEISGNSAPSRNILSLFGESLSSADMDGAMQYVEDSKKEDMLVYLNSLGSEKIVLLGQKILADSKTIYEKSDISLYELDCSFIDLEKTCNFYLIIDSVGEWKVSQM